MTVKVRIRGPSRLARVWGWSTECQLGVDAVEKLACETSGIYGSHEAAWGTTAPGMLLLLKATLLEFSNSIGQSATLDRPDEGPLVAPLQKFNVLPERADFVEKLLGHASAVYYWRQCVR